MPTSPVQQAVKQTVRLVRPITVRPGDLLYIYPHTGYVGLARDGRHVLGQYGTIHNPDNPAMVRGACAVTGAPIKRWTSLTCHDCGRVWCFHHYPAYANHTKGLNSTPVCATRSAPYRLSVNGQKVRLTPAPKGHVLLTEEEMKHVEATLRESVERLVQQHLDQLRGVAWLRDDVYEAVLTVRIVLDLEGLP